MCGRYTLTLTKEELLAKVEQLDAAGWHVERRYNIAPGQVSIVIRPRNDRWVVEEARWGLVPHWSKDPIGGPRPINARAETAASKPLFRAALKHGRCLVPASGFYEWKAAATAKDRKQPFYIRPRGGGLWCFAGLEERWEGPEGELLTFTVLTTEPNALMATLHNRMPVILPRAAWAEWMEAPDPPLRLLVPCPMEEMEAFPVSQAVGTVRNDSVELVRPEGG